MSAQAHTLSDLVADLALAFVVDAHAQLALPPKDAEFWASQLNALRGPQRDDAARELIALASRFMDEHPHNTARAVDQLMDLAALMLVPDAPAPADGLDMAAPTPSALQPVGHRGRGHQDQSPLAVRLGGRASR